MKQLCEKLFEMRTGKNLSRQAVADMLQMSVTTYLRIEEGKSKLDIDKLKLLPEVLGIGMQEILDSLELDVKFIPVSDKNSISENSRLENLCANCFKNENLVKEIKNMYAELLKEKDSEINFLKQEIVSLRKEEK